MVYFPSLEIYLLDNMNKVKNLKKAIFTRVNKNCFYPSNVDAVLRNALFR